MNLLDMINNAGIVNGIFFGVIIIYKNIKTKKNTFGLSLMLIIFSLSIIHSYYVQFLFMNNSFIYEPFTLLIGPLIYMYTSEFALDSKLELKKMFIHILPFIVVFGSILLWRLLLGNEINVMMEYVLWAISIIHIGSYNHFVDNKVSIYTELLQSEFSSTKGKSLDWIEKFLKLFMILNATLVIMFIASRLANSEMNFNVMYSVVISVIVLFFSYKGISTFSQESELKVSNGNLKIKDEAQNHVDVINEFMHKEKPYLNPELTLTDLAARLYLTRNDLSFIINNNFDQNFASFVNQFRIEESKRLLSDMANDSKTIIEICFESGFNSKSTFNTVFKRCTGMTPSMYRKNCTK